MYINLIIQDNINQKVYDISNLVSDITWETAISGQPGKLTFSYMAVSDVIINEGTAVSLKVDNVGIFFGYIFKQEPLPEGIVNIIAYDQLRYLKNKDTYVFSGLTSSQIFEKICLDNQLDARVVDASSYVLADRVFDNKNLFDIIEWGITETLAYNSNWFVIRDNFGTLEYRNINSLKTNLFVGDESLLTNYKYSNSIDDDTYNKIKLVQENKETQKREVYIVQDSANINRWGILQYFETIDEKATEAQIKERAETLLKLKNRATKQLSLNCIGDLRISAGNGLVVGIEALKDFKLDTPQYFLVNNCKHVFKNNKHTMSLELQVSI